MRLVGLLAILTAVAALGGCANIGAAVDDLCVTCCLSCLNGGGRVPNETDSPPPDDGPALAAPAPSTSVVMTY